MTFESRRTSFGAVAGRYDTYRPDWPSTTAAWLTGGDGTSDVLDLGAGTGKLTRTLVAAGHRVTAADPSEGMLQLLSRWLPGVRVVVAPAEHLPLPDHTFDVVTVAQAWHWFDPQAAANECARVLRPGGLLALAWHLRDPQVAWVAELNALTHEPEYANSQAVRDRAVGSLPTPFTTIEHATFRYDRELTPEGLAQVASTWSYVAQRDDSGSVLAQVEDLGRRVAGPAGTLTLPHITYCHRARTPEAGEASG